MGTTTWPKPSVAGSWRSRTSCATARIAPRAASAAIAPTPSAWCFSELVRGIDIVARDCGLLVMSPHVGNIDFLSENLAALPAVLINSQPTESEHIAFGIDNYGGARAMVEHLLAAGHRRVAFIAGPPNNFDAFERLRGYRDALLAADATATPWVLLGDFSESSGHQAGQMLLEAAERPDAVFAARCQRHDGSGLFVRADPRWRAGSVLPPLRACRFFADAAAGLGLR